MAASWSGGDPGETRSGCGSRPPRGPRCAEVAPAPGVSHRLPARAPYRRFVAGIEASARTHDPLRGLRGPLRRTALALLVLTLSLVLADQVLVHVEPTGRDGVVLAQLLDVSREANLPTFWNTTLLVLLAACCAGVAVLVTSTRRSWMVAAVVVIALAADEALRVHERLRSVGSRLAEQLPVALPTYSWVLPGALIALAGALVVWRWTGHLPAPTRPLLRVALVLYGTGAIGVEAVSGWIEQQYGVGPAYRAAAGLEEGLEMAACGLAVVAVLAMVRVIQQDGRHTAVVPAEQRPVTLARGCRPLRSGAVRPSRAPTR